MNNELENIKLSNIIRLSKKRENNNNKRKSHKVFLGGGKKIIVKKKKTKQKEDISPDEIQLYEIECEWIKYGEHKYLLDKKNNVYSVPDENEKYYFVGLLKDDHIEFDKKYQDFISLN